MIAVGVLIPHSLGPGVVAYARAEAVATLSQLAVHPIATVGDSLDVGRWDDMGSHHEAATTTFRSGTHAIRGVCEAAFVAAPSVDQLVDALRRNLELRPGTSLHQWRQGHPMDAAAWEELGAVLHRHAHGHPDADPPPDGLVVADSEEALGLRRWGPGAGLAVGRGGLTVRARRWCRVGRHLVPRAVWATLRGDEAPSTWWDGNTFGTCGGPDDLPEHLRCLLDRSGHAELPAAGDCRPLTDYQPTFVVRQPSLGEARRCLGVDAFHVRDLHPALLVEADRAVPLPASGPRTFIRPEEALAVLRRCTGRAFVPHARPVTDGTLHLDAHPRWYVGALPRTVARG